MTILTIFEFEAKERKGDELLDFFKRILPEKEVFKVVRDCKPLACLMMNSLLLPIGKVRVT